MNTVQDILLVEESQNDIDLALICSARGEAG